MGVIGLRTLDDSDDDELFRMMSDPDSVSMAAFTPDDPTDRVRFDAHQARIRADPEVTTRAVTYDGAFAGMIASFVMVGDTEITYWIDRKLWGLGIATEALTLFLTIIQVRPLYARAALDNVASRRVLEKAGFRQVGTEVSYAAARRADIAEAILRLG
ncbi:GNAT family N-acetyltransferase [Actinoplanes sp. TBRC 11911]|uniref:GNAT family N-acetyltransferase n=1 Tax=Actinoplanes sp. TBRC 11911 TaxID=2729386 RepID=UPI00145CAC7C|nr:GNAT family N-acetyltransferase [Actinoplanes sp. TBRC 11911]NMO56563.1 GNAT family N-acetyltransferase [Actinoplanes sp. TBRC 11911]